MCVCVNHESEEMDVSGGVELKPHTHKHTHTHTHEHIIHHINTCGDDSVTARNHTNTFHTHKSPIMEALHRHTPTDKPPRKFSVGTGECDTSQNNLRTGEVYAHRHTPTQVHTHRRE
eukprot:GHVR01176163.1.p2 GENE.GHVR01176163.1~~GHVR01176163.1.p2  ORF type:complete len:117 (-),score=59.17 GHVR01176163.1:461-811(-)